MTRNNLLPVLSFTLLLSMFSILLTAKNTTSTPAHLKYMENKGQWADEVLFRAESYGQNIYLEKDGFTFLYWNPKQVDDFMHRNCSESEHEHNCDQHDVADEDYKIDFHAVMVKLDGANELTKLEATETLPEIQNYLKGNDPSKWGTGIHPSKKVWYRNVYDNIDLSTYSNLNRFKYDFVVKPNANPEQIAMRYEGQHGLCTKNDELYLTTSINETIELKPYAYQIIEGKTIKIECTYLLEGDLLRFNVGEYNTNYDLVIDPELVASTYTGTTGSLYGHSATFGSRGEIYGACRAFDANYPITPGAFQTSNFGTDVGVSKYDENGVNLFYATLLGGNGTDLVTNLIENNDRELVLLINTGSSDFPTTDDAFDISFNGGSTDMTVTILSVTGDALVGSTYVGGGGGEVQASPGFPGIDGYGLRGELMVDEANNIYVASVTGSANFPTTSDAFQTTYGGGTYDGTLSKFNPTLSEMLWGTFLGGSASDAAYGVRIAEDGTVWVAGSTESNNFPTTDDVVEPTSTASDKGWLTHLTADGEDALASTYISTPSGAAVYFVDLDPLGNPYVAGKTTSGDFPVTPGAYSTPNGGSFVAKLNQSLSSYQLSTQMGESASGFGSNNLTAFNVDNCEYIYLGGFTNDGALPTTPDAFEDNGDFGASFYFFVLEEGAADLHYATYVGAGQGSHVDGGTCRYDAFGSVYQAVCTSQSGFPITDPTYSEKLGGGWDMVVFKFDFGSTFFDAQVEATPAASGCPPFTVNFSNATVGAIEFEWDFGDGSSISTAQYPSHTFEEVGVYNVQMIARNPETCTVEDTAYVLVDVYPSIPLAASFDHEVDGNCDNLTIQFESAAFDILAHSWDFGDGTASSNEINPKHSFNQQGTYEVTLTVTSTQNDCLAPGVYTQTVDLTQKAVSASTLRQEGCQPLTVTMPNNSSFVSESEWRINEQVYNENTPTVSLETPGTYEVRLVAKNPESCNGFDTTYNVILVYPDAEANFNKSHEVLAFDQALSFTNLSLDA
ncbi:MAG: PKD domain-containing protein, partial [Chitinophagales bacterium]